MQIRQNAKKLEEHVLHDAKSILADENKLVEKYVMQVNPNKLEEELLVKIGMSIIHHQDKDGE